MTTQSIRAFERAIKIVGTQDRLASILKIKVPSMYNWRTSGQVPAARCLGIERATHGEVTRYDLRPDIYGAKPKESS